MNTIAHEYLPVSLEGKSILLIDDNSDDRVMIRHLIKTSTYPDEPNFLEAESYTQALQVFKENEPYCCVLDYNLADKTGLDFLLALKRLQLGENIPVVVLTGVGDERVAVEMMQNGAQDYLSKTGVSSESLVRSIHYAVRTCHLQNNLYRLAHYDCLTGLLNRNLFLDRLSLAMARCDRKNSSCSLLFLDIDNFKKINDHYGHNAGDYVLKEAGIRIKKICRLMDSCARLGGDEFAILLEDIDKKSTKDTVKKIIDELMEPFIWDINPIDVSVSIGIAYYPGLAGNRDELLRQADEAMYDIKRTGKNNYLIFNTKQKHAAARKQALAIVLPKAIKNGELELFYQPIVNISDLSLYSLEVLVRWNTSKFPIEATELIDMVDRFNLFDIYHKWLIQTSLTQLSEWKGESGNENIRLSINIPAHKCHSSSLMQYLNTSMAQYDIKPEQIELEITETTLMVDAAFSNELLTSIHEQGVGVAIDDFGVGYSSMAYLTTLPIDNLKIDKHFFIGKEKDERNHKVVDAMVSLGHKLGLKVIAEGVETKAQCEMATKLGCDLAQGYYLGRPKPALDNWKNFYNQYPKLPN